MALKGNKFTIFGSFSKKKDAKRKERQGRGRFILKRGERFIVLKSRER